MDAADEASLPILSVVRYTNEDQGYDEVFISLRDGQKWSGRHEEHELANMSSQESQWLDLDVVRDEEQRVVALIFRDASDVHPSLLAIAQRGE